MSEAKLKTYHCHRPQIFLPEIARDLEAASLREAVDDFYREENVLPAAVDGVGIEGICPGCDALVLEDEGADWDSDGNVICRACAGERRNEIAALRAQVTRLTAQRDAAAGVAYATVVGYEMVLGTPLATAHEKASLLVRVAIATWLKDVPADQLERIGRPMFDPHDAINPNPEPAEQ